MKALWKLTVASLAALASVTGLGLVRGDEPQPVKPPPVVEADKGRLNDEQLSALIKGMGYTEKLSTSTDGKTTYHQLNLVVANFRYVIDMSLQSEGKKIYFSCPLRKISEPDKVPAEKLLALLAKNDEMAPTCFSYFAERKQFFLNHEIDNINVDAAKMQETFDALKHLLSSTFPMWDTTKWPGGPQPATAQKDQPK